MKPSSDHFSPMKVETRVPLKTSIHYSLGKGASYCFTLLLTQPSTSPSNPPPPNYHTQTHLPPYLFCNVFCRLGSPLIGPSLSTTLTLLSPPCHTLSSPSAMKPLSSLLHSHLAFSPHNPTHYIPQLLCLLLTCPPSTERTHAATNRHHLFIFSIFPSLCVLRDVIRLFSRSWFLELPVPNEILRAGERRPFPCLQLESAGLHGGISHLPACSPSCYPPPNTDARERARERVRE